MARRWLLILVATICAACSGGSSTGRPAHPDARPNVVVILADDLDLAEVRFMPNVERLIAAPGATLTHYFISNSLCCPSRTTMLLGQYAHDTGILANAGPQGGFPALYRRGGERSTVATWLAAAHYDSALVGKYLNGYPERAGRTYRPPGWTRWWGAVDSDNAYGEYDYDVVHDGERVHHGHAPSDYGTYVYRDEAQRFIREETSAGRAFFCDLAVFAPHQPATPAPEDLHAFATAIAPRPPSFDEADVSDKPAWLRALPRLSPDVVTHIDELYRDRIRSLQAVDRAVASIIGELQRDGALANTYVVFTSDNGFHLGEHRLPAGKRTPYDDDIHVPFFVRGPGIAPGSTVDAITGNVDLAPTIAQIAGAKVPPEAEGRSLLPLWHGAHTSSWRTGYLVEHAPDPLTGDRDVQIAGRGVLVAAEPATIPTYEGVRTADALYVEWATGERELYDLRRDPYELANQAAHAPPALLARWHTYLAALVGCHGAGCRAADSAAVP